MDFFGFPPLALILDLAYRALMALSALLEPLAGSTSAALAVLLTTLIVRAFLVPAGVMQAKAEQVRARLAPKLRLLQQRHRADPERLQRETMQLYRDENASPLAGCVPLMVQAPIIGILYAVFLHPVIAGHANALLTQTLWGVPLGQSLFGAMSAGMAPDPVCLLVFGGLLLTIAVVGEITRRAFRPVVDAVPPPVATLLAFLPFASVGLAAFVPLAAGLYLAVTVAWTLAQRLLLRRRYPAA